MTKRDGFVPDLVILKARLRRSRKAYSGNSLRTASTRENAMRLRESGGASGPSDVARALAQSYFDEPYWPSRHVFAWIRFRTPDFLTVSYEEIRSLHFHVLFYTTSPWPSPVVTGDPADALCKRLKEGKIEAIRFDGSRMPAIAWYTVGHYPSTWPGVMFRRDDVLREWPERGHGEEPIAMKAKTNQTPGAHRVGAQVLRVANELKIRFPVGRPVGAAGRIKSMATALNVSDSTVKRAFSHLRWSPPRTRAR
jgi:hypothetical protein